MEKGWLNWTLQSFIVLSLITGANGTVDLGFILDGTSTVRNTNPPDGSYDNWQIMLDFVASFTLGLPETARVGAIVLASKPKVEFYLNSFSNLTGAAAAIHNLSYPSTGSNTAGALRLARVRLFNQSKGDRPDAPNIIIIITDGGSLINAKRTVPNANALHQMGIEVIGIGIGNRTDTAELQAISSPPHDENVNYFTRSRFQDLGGLTDIVLNLVIPPANEISEGSEEGNKIILAIVIPVVFGLIIAILVIVICCVPSKMKNKRSKINMDVSKSEPTNSKTVAMNVYENENEERISRIEPVIKREDLQRMDSIATNSYIEVIDEEDYQKEGFYEE